MSGAIGWRGSAVYLAEEEKRRRRDLARRKDAARRRAELSRV